MNVIVTVLLVMVLLFKSVMNAMMGIIYPLQLAYFVLMSVQYVMDFLVCNVMHVLKDTF